MLDEEQNEPAVEEGSKRRSFVWVLLAALLAVGAYAAMLIPALAGRPPQPISAYSSMIWSAVLFAVLWRYRRRSGWIGVGVGVVFGIIVFALATFISGYMGSEAGAT